MYNKVIDKRDGGEIVKKDIIIIGGGIAGLTAGIYAQENGYQTKIIEQHYIPGGNCTGWSRNGYYFEGGLHWLAGAKIGTAMHPIWEFLNVLREDVEQFSPSGLLIKMLDKQALSLSNNLKELEQTLLALAPEDSKQTKELCSDIEKFMVMSMQVKDLPRLKRVGKTPRNPSILQMFPAIMRFPKLSKVTAEEYAEQWNSKVIQTFLKSVCPKGFAASTVLITLSTKLKGDGVYLAGGSVALAQRMVDKYEQLGGEIVYKEKVEEVLVDKGKAIGVQTKKATYIADHVIVTADAKLAQHFFATPIHARWLQEVAVTQPVVNTFISVGISADLSKYDETVIVELEQGYNCCGEIVTDLAFNNYAQFASYAPPGCSSITINNLQPHAYDWWKAHKDAGTYRAAKMELEQEVRAVIVECFPELVNKIEVVDIATPLTYARYCGTEKGAWMSVMHPGSNPSELDGRLDNITNVYFAGQRLQMPGGLPVAVLTGRKAVQYICREDNKVFLGV